MSLSYSDIAYELQKLYPEVKIPVKAHTEYYLDQLRQSRQYDKLDQQLRDVRDLLDAHGQVSKKGDWEARDYKMRWVGKFKDLFGVQRDWLAKLNSRFPAGEPLHKKGFEPADGELYVSVDVRSANFSTLNYLLDLGAATWDEFVGQHFPDMHPALRNSKSYRQLLFGNLNPGRIQAFTSSVMAQYLLSIQGLGLNVVGVSPDEIIIHDTREDLNSLFDLVQQLATLPWEPKMPVRITPFSVELRVDEETHETVRVDTVMELGLMPDSPLVTNSYLRLHGVPGNRFHHHFARYILGQEPDYEDNLFELDGRVAQWV